MSKDRRLSQEPNWVKDYNNATVSAGRGKQVSLVDFNKKEMFKKILERGPFTREDMLEAFKAGCEGEDGLLFDEWFGQYIENKNRGKK